jgi:hypothetical protein
VAERSGQPASPSSRYRSGGLLVNLNISPWHVGVEGLWFGEGLNLSFQRCVLPEDGVHRYPPKSLGTLSIGAGRGGDLFLPLEKTESFWIGIQRCHPDLSIACAIRGSDGRLLDVRSGKELGSPDAAQSISLESSAVDGIARSEGGIWALTSQWAPTKHPRQCLFIQARLLAPNAGEAGIELCPDSGIGPLVQIHLVDYETFSQETGLKAPPPLNISAGYQGWLLP